MLDTVAVQRPPELTYWPSGLKLASHPVLSGPVLRRSVTLPLKASIIYSVPPATADISLPSGLKVTPWNGCALFASSGTCEQNHNASTCTSWLAEALQTKQMWGTHRECVKGALVVGPHIIQLEHAAVAADAKHKALLVKGCRRRAWAGHQTLALRAA